jgi:hypothetical protein
VYAVDDLDWKRFWSPRDATPLLEDEGYLVDPESAWLRRHTRVRELAELHAVPCLILLGEPGMGKSRTIARTVQVRSWLDHGAAVLAVDLRYQRLDDLLAAQEYTEYLRGAHDLHLFIDSLDESLDEQATTTLIRILRSHPVHRLRLRVACRTGAVPLALEPDLRRIWRDSGKTDADVQSYELAPLRTLDVRLAARSFDVDPDAFFAALLPHRAAPFAARPITLLHFLLPMFKAQRTFPGQRWDLFEAGCRHLCEDPSLTRHDAGTVGAQTADERMTIAGRIAAACILGRRNLLARNSLHRRPVSDGAAAGLFEDVALDELAGVEATDDGDVLVTSAALQEVVQHTLLFTAYGPWHLVWNHRSFAEFLTARFLAARKLDDDDLVDLMFPAPEAGVPAELQEVAAWVLTRRPRLVAEAFKRDLPVAMRGDLRAFTEEQRAALVEAVLAWADRREFADNELLLRRVYPDMKHACLATQLEPWIRDGSRFLIARRIAIELAGACREAALSAALLDLAMDVGEAIHLRARAVHALKHLAVPQQKVVLRSLVGTSHAHDPQDELLGDVLYVLWPDHLNTSELLAALHPARDRSFSGNYENFLARHLVPGLSDAEIPCLLDWMTAHPQEVEEDGGLAACCRALWQRSWATIDDPAVADALARYAHRRIATHTTLVPRTVWMHDELSDVDPVARKIFLRAFAALVSPTDAFHTVDVLGRNKLVSVDDVSWLIERLGNPLNPAQETFWAEALTHVARRLPQDGPEWARVVDSAEQHALLKQTLLDIFGPIPLMGRQAELLRRAWNEEQKHRAYLAYRLDPPPESRVLASLEVLDNGEISQLETLQKNLSLREDSRHYTSGIGIGDYPGWQSADAALRTRIVRGHKQYLLQASPPSLPHDGAALHRDTLTACRALYLLLLVEPEWLGGARNDYPERPYIRGFAFWTKWIPALVAEAAQTQDQVDRPSMLRLAYLGCPASFIGALEPCLRKGSNFNCRYLDMAWDPALAALLLRVVQDSETSIYVLQSALEALARHEAPTLTALLDTLVPLPPPHDASPRDRAQAAAWTLFLWDTQRAWPHLVAVFQADPRFGTDLLEDRGLSLSDAIKSWHLVTSSHLVEIYQWFVQAFPPRTPRTPRAPRTRPRRMGAFSPHDTVQWARNAIRDLLIQRDLADFDESMKNLLATDPTLHEIELARIEARKRHAQSTWRPLPPIKVLALRARWRRCFDPRSPSENRDARRMACRLLEHVFEDVVAMRRWLTTLPDADAFRRECPEGDGSLASLADLFVVFMYRTKDNSWVGALASRAHQEDIELLASAWNEPSAASRPL